MGVINLTSPVIFHQPSARFRAHIESAMSTSLELRMVFWLQGFDPHRGNPWSYSVGSDAFNSGSNRIAATAISCSRPSLLDFVPEISDNHTIMGTVMKYVAMRAGRFKQQKHPPMWPVQPAHVYVVWEYSHRRQADVVVINLGTNDFIFNNPTKETFQSASWPSTTMDYGALI